MAAPSVHSGPAAGSDEIGDLISQVADLRQRVTNLENRLGMTASASPTGSESVPPLTLPGVDLSPSLVPVLGRTLIAIAGAYVLRALTEWGVLPAAAGVALGLIYALFWLWFAARTTAQAKLAVVLSCFTSVLIMGPLVWEATERLKVMSSWMSSGVLTAFVLIALVLASKSRLIGTIAGVFSISMAVALLLARDDIVPFTTALLVIAGATEFAAWRDLRPGARALAALAADGSVLLFSWMVSSGHGMPERWVPVSPYAVLAAQTGLALIYIGTAVIQTVARHRTLAFAEMAQTAAALSIGIGGAVWVFREHHAIMLGLGIAAMAGGMACYALSFLLFEHDNKWNFRAWATFGLLLVLAGISLPFSRAGFWVLACGCAMACCWAARAWRLPTLGLHGAVFLSVGSAAAGASGLPLMMLFGMGTGPVQWLASIAVLLIATASWAAIAGISTNGAGRWRNQISSLAIAAHIVWIIAGLAVYLVLAMWRATAGALGGGALGASAFPADTLGTVVITVLSLVLGWAGTRWGRRELVWLLCGFMLLGAYKLLIRDLPREHNIALVVSLLCYGGALILLPRILRGKPPRSAA